MDYHAERRSLLARLDSVDSPRAALDYQRALIVGLEATAEAVHGDDAQARDARKHREKLLLLGDGLAWKSLHPHAIRQLAKNSPGRSGWLVESEALSHVLKTAEAVLEASLIPLIADVTNVLRIGDLVLVGDPEAPLIVECKSTLPHPSSWKRGRLGRQISRALATTRYLRGSATSVYGEPHPRVVIEADHHPERSWDTVSKCVKQAADQGVSVLPLSDQECFWAYRNGLLEDAFRLVDALMPKECRGAIVVGSSLRSLQEHDGLFPPPVAWPIPLEERLALFEEHVIVAHLVDIAAFCGEVDGVHIGIGDAADAHPIVATVGGAEFRLSMRVVNEVVYGYQTIASYKRGIASFVKAAMLLDEEALDKELDTVAESHTYVATTRRDANGTRIILVDVSEHEWKSHQREAEE